eukprot:TRINITY_DN17459_c0_g1_i2.p1 TRINITY_DN17459_c0_g1~~TRINITY_DN17459_c0_g1_i2.p1  ORF type:complete len:189 (+),score=50.02 TRINITY_DN17459_c0_g1_i2:60-569(+)
MCIRDRHNAGLMEASPKFAEKPDHCARGNNNSNVGYISANNVIFSQINSRTLISGGESPAQKGSFPRVYSNDLNGGGGPYNNQIRQDGYQSYPTNNDKDHSNNTRLHTSLADSMDAEEILYNRDSDQGIVMYGDIVRRENEDLDARYQGNIRNGGSNGSSTGYPSSNSR